MAARHMRNVRQGFISLNQPSMISDVLVGAGENEDATEIIEESSHHGYSRLDSGNDGSELE